MKKIRIILSVISYGFLYLLISLYTFIFNNSTGWSLWMFASTLLILIILSLISPLTMLQVTQQDSIETEVNDILKIPLEVSKKTHFPMLFLELDFKENTPRINDTFYFYYGQKKLATAEWMPEQRGYYSSINLTVFANDIFGIFTKKKKIEATTNLFVLPKRYELRMLAYFQRKIQRTSFGDNDFSIKNYRSYELGDDIKKIDWKLSSRQQEIILKEYHYHQEVDWVFVFYGQQDRYFEETLAFFFNLQEQLELRKNQVVLLGEKTSDLELNKRIARIEPLKSAQKIPVFSNHKILLFTPLLTEELTQQLQDLPQKQAIEIVTYQDLLQLESEGRV